MENQIYAYVGLITIAIAVVYLFSKALKFNNAVLEGLTTRQSNTKSITEVVEALNKANEQIGYRMLIGCSELATNMSKTETKDISKEMEKLSNMQQTRTMLNDLLKFVDNATTNESTSKISSFF
jgi:hypothetical protein